MDDLQSKDTQTSEVAEDKLEALEVESFKETELSQSDEGSSQFLQEGKRMARDEFDFISPSDPLQEQSLSAPSNLDLEDTRVEMDWPQSEKTPEHELEDTIISPAVSAKTKKTPKVESTNSKRRRNRQRMKQETAAKRIAATVVVVVLLALAITAYTGYSYVKSSLEPMDPTSTKIVQVEIPEGSSTKEIGNILVQNQLIKNATIFNYYAKLKSYNNFQSGYYNLSQSMSVDELAKTLQESGTPTPVDPIAGKVLVIEGYTIEQIAQAVTDNVYTKDKDDKTSFSSEEFLETVKNPDFINRMVAKYPKLFANLPAADSGVKYQLEGYLFPATYEYTKSTSMEELVEKMITAMDANLQSYYGQLSSMGLTVNQLLTLASLVEKEGATDEDRRNIASVFYNRLNISMPLQSNIAILYAMGKLGQETTLEEDATIDTNIDSPYNIYVRAGLMPGPVDSPSLSAIQATLKPNDTEYYYFVADVTTGTVYYSATVEEHNQNVEKYVNSKLNQ
ncbi:endolytic transglycosylase MltG [Streptococcus minor]|uniref:Endolytic murein transglycosylase n=1 Tax=Streptococcus minor TaxID=229549 RepID=A0A3P1VCA7_9STRE|nr:endolytic transglycosylase MltG [Streptococcus minor]RRD31804.1 endolytic transglycosylase MltG [Streptococcus minor]